MTKQTEAKPHPRTEDAQALTDDAMDRVSGGGIFGAIDGYFKRTPKMVADDRN